MAYTEDGLVEQSAINLFSQLDWNTAICWDESFDDKTGYVSSEKERFDLWCDENEIAPHYLNLYLCNEM